MAALNKRDSTDLVEWHRGSDVDERVRSADNGLQNLKKVSLRCGANLE
jgi:hypothetical protein